MSTIPYVLGMDAKTYCGAAGASLATLLASGEVDNIKNLTLTLEAGESDVTTRGNSGWEATAATLRKCGAEFEMLYKPGDLQFQALKTAFLAETNVRLAILTGAMNGEDAEGPVGDFSVSNFSRNEQLTEGVLVPVSVKLAVWDKWLEPPIVADQAFTAPSSADDLDVVDTLVVTQGADMSGETLKYEITAATVAGVFAIGISDGEITVADKTSIGAAGTVHVLTVKVSYVTADLPYATATATITITVAPPVALDDDFTVAEGSANSTVVDTVIATAGADMEGETLVYEILTQTVDGVFAIDSEDGEITVLDNTSLGSENDEHELSVRISYDTAGLPTTTVTITITISES